MPYFSFRSFNCSSFFFVSIFWKACKEKTKKMNVLNFVQILDFFKLHFDLMMSTDIDAHTYSVCIVVEDHQVTVADVEA